jgi:hypothetical protein
MALLFLDTFDHIVATKKWNRVGGYFSDFKIPGRTGYCHNVFGQETYSWRIAPTVRSTIAVGAAIKPFGFVDLDAASGLGVGNTRCIDGYPGIGASLTVEVTSEGGLYLKFSNAAIVYATTPSTRPVVTAGEWYFIEVWARLYSVSGPDAETAMVDAKLRVNEELLIDTTLSGYTKSGGGLFFPGENGWAQITTPWTAYIDDVYVTDGEFLGDVRIYRIRPSGPGDEMQWGVVGASSGWEAVRNEDFEWAGLGNQGNTLDDSYVRAYSTDIGKSFLVNMEDINPLGPIRGVQANFVNCKTEAGTAAFSPRYKISGQYYDSPMTIYPSWGSWYDRVEPFRKNPVTGQDWTTEDVNTMQIGAKRVL